MDGKGTKFLKAAALSVSNMGLLLLAQDCNAAFQYAFLFTYAFAMVFLVADEAEP